MPMPPFLKEKTDECRQLYLLGSSVNDLVEKLHDEGLSLDEVCVVMGSLLDIEPNVAKIFVAEHPIWVEVIDQASPIIEQVIQVLGNDGTVEDLGDGVIVFREQPEGGLPESALV